MDLILLILSLSRRPMLASELAPLVSRDVTAVRATLASLARAGLAQRRQVSTRGPQGTWAWIPTPAGAAGVDTLGSWIRQQVKP